MMFLTNHALTGLVLSRVIDDPLLLAPVALGSHFVLDSLPHFGRRNAWPFGSKPWIMMAAADNLVALSVFGVALILYPEHWLLIVTGVFFAALPDLMFIIELLRKQRFKGAWRRFHSHIQWSETPAGVVVEMAWAAGCVILLSRLNNW